MPNSIIKASEACHIAVASCHEIDFVTAHKSSRQTGKKVDPRGCVPIHPTDVYTTRDAECFFLVNSLGYLCMVLVSNTLYIISSIIVLSSEVVNIFFKKNKVMYEVMVH